MSRVKRGVTANKRRNRILKRAKGFSGGRSKLTTVAQEAVDRSAANAYRGRKLRKRDFRSLWICRVNAASRSYGLTYSRLKNLLKNNSISINLKLLAQIALLDKKTFSCLIEKVQVN